MPTQNYWINRANQRMDAYILQSEQTADEIAKAYYKASKQIEKEMAKVLNGLSAISDPQTAVRALKSNPDPKLITQLRKAVGAMPDGKEKQEALTLISSPAYQFRLRRLQATLDNAKKECERLYKAELNGTTKHLRGLYNDAFLHTAYDIDKGYNVLHTFSMFPASRVNKLLKMRWSGLNYSERIWNNTQNLADALKDQMLVAFMTGAGVSSTARAISEQFQTSAYNARRLVRTETNFIANQAEMDAYKRLGIEQYKYIATLDTRTSAVCQSLDGQVFSCDNAQAGVNLPPMHPNCRSTTIMYDAEQPLKERVARDENGNTIRVPGDTTYKQWLEKYHPELVDKVSKRGIINTGRNMANGMRKSPSVNLTEEDKEFIRQEIKVIGADESIFVFRDYFGSGYNDTRDKVYVSSNVFPSLDGSNHPRDVMSVRAVLAHEYYGHRANRNTSLEPGSWNDEFRASYYAAKNCPNLTDEDRYYLILDALERAKEAGVSIKYNDFMRRILYGY